jgi:hypothetical protein
MHDDIFFDGRKKDGRVLNERRIVLQKGKMATDTECEPNVVPMPCFISNSTTIAVVYP